MSRVMNFGFIFSLSCIFHFCSCHLSNAELLLLIKSLKSQVDQLAAKYEQINKENMELRDRISDLEKNRDQLEFVKGKINVRVSYVWKD